MADVSIGSVSLGMQLDKADLLSQMKDITQSAASILQNGLSNALRLGKTDMSGVIGSIGEVKTEVKALSTMIGAVIEKGMKTGAKDGVAAVTAAVSTVKMPTVKVTATKGDLTNQLNNMVSLLDNTNAQIYTQQQMVDELKRRWNAMGNLGQQDSDAGLAMKQSILKAEAALTGLEGKSDTMAMKTRAMESAIVGFGTSGAQSVEKVVAAATMADKKLSSVGNSGNLSGKKIASGINSADKSVKSLSASAMSATGLDKRLSSIERNVAKTTRSVTALGRRFMVLFVGKIISAAFKDVTASLTGASEKSDTLKNSLNSLTTAGRTISNAVVTAIAPLINIVGPALSNVSEMVRTFSNRVAMFFAAVSGQSTVLQAKKTFAAYTAGATSAGNAAEKAQKQMAGFDNLNILASPVAASGGSGSSGGTNSDDFETVATQGSELATKVRSAIDMLKEPLDRLWTSMGPLLGQLQIFWDKYLVPFGLWTIGTGLPALVDVLAKVFTWLNDNPGAVKGIAAFAAACLVLSGISKISVGVSAVLSGLGLLGPAILGRGAVSAIPVALTTTAVGALADLIGFAALGATIYMVYKVVEASQSGGANGVRDLIDETINGLDSSTGGGWTETANAIANAFPTTDNYNPNPSPDTRVLTPYQAKNWSEIYGTPYTGGSQYLEQVMPQLAPRNYTSDVGTNTPALNTASLDLPTAGAAKYSEVVTNVATQLRKSNEANVLYAHGMSSVYDTTQGASDNLLTVGTSASASSRGVKNAVNNILNPALSSASTYVRNGASSIVGSFAGIPSSVSPHVNALSGVVSSGASSVNGSFGGMNTSAQYSMSNLGSTVSSGATTTANSLMNGISGGVNSTVGIFSGLFGATKPHLDSFGNSVSAASTSAGRSLIDGSDLGRRGAIGAYQSFSNQVTQVFETLDSNIKRVMTHVVQMMAWMPQTLSSKAIWASTVGLAMSSVTGLRMYANGGYIGANQPQLAIVGDNKTQGEIITPENAMAAAVAKGIAAAGGGGSGNQTINITVQSVLDGRVIAESTTKYQAKKSRQSNKPAFA